MGNFISGANVSVLVPETVSAEVMKEIPQQSQVLQLAKRLPNMPAGVESLPVLSALPIAYFPSGAPGDSVGEKGLRHTTNVEWADKKLYAEEIHCIVPIENRYLEDSRFDIWGEVKPLIPEAMGIALDQAILYGTNAPTNWPTNIYASCVAKGLKVALGTDVYANILGKNGVVAKVEKNGYFPTGHIAGLSMRGELREVRDDLGRPIFSTSMQNTGGYALDGQTILFPETGVVDESKTAMFTGAWNKIVYSFRRDMYMKIMDQAVIQDPTTKEILFNLAQQNMTGLFCFMRIAWQLPNPINRTNANSLTRYPFAILTPAASS